MKQWIALVLLGALTACGSSEPSVEEQLAETQALLGDAREAVRAATAELEIKQQALIELQTELDGSREKLAAAQIELAEAESTVDIDTTDTLLFRAIQQRLLDDERLDGVAIRAEVSRGNVTLSGTVDSEDQVEAAETLAAEVPGVGLVESKIEVSTPAVTAGPDDSDE